jgi:competence protein ComEA
LLTALLVGVLLMVGAISALRSMPQAVDLADAGVDHALPDSAGATDVASGDGPGSATGADTSADVAVGGNPGGAVVVHVAGQVARPGVVTLPLGARVAEAIAAAGGAVAGTSLDGLNLARRVSDGEQVYVGTPQPGAAPQGSPASGAAPPGSPASGADGGAAGSGAGDSTLIDLNLASSEELQELPRIGPATAAKIIAHREANGTFTSVDQLLDVPGIGERTLEGLRDQVRV